MKRVVVLALLCACSKSVAAPVTPCASPRSVHETYHADTSFLPSERDEIRRATDRMREISQGRIDIRAVFDLDFDSTRSIVENSTKPRIVRKLEWMPSVTLVDMQFRSHVFAWTTVDATAQVNLIVDRIPDLQWVTAHELGHAVGWNGRADDQGHADDFDAVFARGYHGQSAWTPADTFSCRNACLCD